MSLIKLSAYVAASLGLAAAGCKVSTSGLLNRATGSPGSTGSSGSSSSSDDSSSASSDSGGSSSGDSAGAVAKHPVPAWCKTTINESASIENATSRERADWALDAIVSLMCSENRGDDVERRWADLEDAHAFWSKRLMMTDADWGDAVPWSLESPQQRGTASVAYKKKDGLFGLDALQQYNLMGSYSFLDRHYFADALGTQLSETGRMSYVEQCLDSDKVGEWAICHPDLLALDAKKASAELRTATSRTPIDRITLRLRLDGVVQAIPGRVAAVKALIAKDPAYGTLFAFGPAAHKAWAARKGEGLEVAAAADDARLTGSRKAIAGCMGRTWKGLEAALARMSAKDFADLLDEPGRNVLQKSLSVMLDDVDFYLAASAFASCAAVSDEVDYLVRVLGSELRFRPGYRGPRTSAHSAMIAANLELDDRDARIEFPAFDRSWFESNTTSGESGRGTVASAKPDGDKVVVTFTKEMAKSRICANWRGTNRIIGINQDGSFRFDSVCTSFKWEVYDAASPPQTVLARYAGTLKPGVFASIVDGAVLMTWTKEGASVPLSVLGVPVK